MTDHKQEPHGSHNFIAEAGHRFNDMNAVLLRAITEFAETASTERSAKNALGLIDSLKIHSRILQTLLESEADIAKCRKRQAQGEPAPGGQPIDLDTARKKIAAEISHIAAARRSDEGA